MYGVYFAGIAIAIRLIAHYTGTVLDPRAVIMIHLLLVLLAVFFESNKQKKTGQGDFVSLFKSGMRAGVVYAIITAVFCFVYYAKIAPEIFELRNAALLEGVQEGAKAEEQREMITTMFRPINYAQGSFFGYFLMSVFYSLIVAFLHRRILK